MPSNSATHLIFFIAAIFIALTLVGAFTLVIDDLTDAMENRAETEQKSIRSRVEIINDLTAMPYNNTSKKMDLYVKNTGTQRLDPDQSLILIDGINKTFTWNIVGGGTNWTQGLTVVFTLSNVDFAANTDHSARVICSPGGTDQKTFSIRSLP
jgi:archaellum component FlaG (FlaF/FlaG flagellin family)